MADPASHAPSLRPGPSKERRTECPAVPSPGQSDASRGHPRVGVWGAPRRCIPRCSEHQASEVLLTPELQRVHEDARDDLRVGVSRRLHQAHVARPSARRSGRVDFRGTSAGQAALPVQVPLSYPRPRKKTLLRREALMSKLSFEVPGTASRIRSGRNLQRTCLYVPIPPLPCGADGAWAGRCRVQQSPVPLARRP